jgi:F-type H+-transporting ATPase subunit alpha
LDDLPINAVRKFETELLAFLEEKYPEVLETIESEKALSPASTATLDKAIAALKSNFKA